MPMPGQGSKQPHSPSFVPELLIHWIVQAATGSWRVAMATFVLLLIVWLMTIMSWIVARIAQSGREAAILSVVLVATPLIAAGALGRFGSNDAGAFFPWLFFVQPNSHGGTFLLALTAAAVAGRATTHAMAYGPIWVALLSFVAYASDQLTLVFFLAPVTAALLGAAVVQVGSRQSALRVLAGAWGGAALGGACTVEVDRQYMLRPTPSSMLEHAGRFLADLGHHPVPVLTIAALTLGLVAIAWRREPRTWVAGFWPIFATSSAVGSLALTMVLYEDIGSFRYAHPLLWWAAMFAAAALAKRGRSLARRLPRRPFGAACLASGLALSGPLAGWHVPRLLVWDSPPASCLRQAGMRAGLAEYWYARLTSAASDWGIQVEQVDSFGAARIWGNDRLWFTHDIHDTSRRPRFQFVIIDSLPEDRIAAAYGKPDRRMACGSATVWIYDEPGKLYRDLARASPGLEDLFAVAPPNF